MCIGYSLTPISKIYKNGDDDGSLNLFGLRFTYDIETETFDLVESALTSDEIMKISEKIFQSTNSINAKGYINEKSLPYHFIKQIARYLRERGL